MFRMLGIHLFYPWHRNPNSNDRDNPVGLGSHPWLPEKLLKGVELLKVNGGNFAQSQWRKLWSGSQQLGTGAGGHGGGIEVAVGNAPPSTMRNTNHQLCTKQTIDYDYKQQTCQNLQVCFWQFSPLLLGANLFYIKCNLLPEKLICFKKFEANNPWVLSESIYKFCRFYGHMKIDSFWL